MVLWFSTSTHINGDGREIEQAGVVGARVWSHFQQGGRSSDNGGDVKNLKLKRTGGRDSGIEKECLRLTNQIENNFQIRF